MKVLILGPTGNLGSRLLPSLIAHKHSVVAFVRPSSVSKVPASITPHLVAIATGDAKSSADIKKALLEYECDAVVNTAGLASMTPWGKSDLPEIFQAVVDAAVEVGKARKEAGKGVLRCWMLGGFSALDAADTRYCLADYIPVFPEHKKNIAILQALPQDDLLWSVLCPHMMNPLAAAFTYPPPTRTEEDRLLVTAGAPPKWKKTMCWLPLLGGYLNVMLQSGMGYATYLEDNADFIARDLLKGKESEWCWKKVGVKEEGGKVKKV